MTIATSHDALAALIASLEQGDEVTEAMRRDLIGALYDLALYHAIDEKRHKRGTPIAADTWLAARIAQRLVDDYGVTPKEAVYAARPQADIKEFGRIKRNYHKLKSGKAPINFGPVHPHLVDQAANNINHDRLVERVLAMVKGKK